MHISHADKNLPVTTEQKASYALAIEYMRNLQEDGFKLDKPSFIQGINDLQSGRASRLNQEELKKAKDFYTVKSMEFRQEKLEERKMAGRSFLLANKFKEGVVELPSGLQYQVLQQGAGAASAKPDEGVSVRYRISDTDNKLLLSSAPDGTPQKFVPNAVFPAWREAFGLMRPGDKWRLFIPPELAFGDNGGINGHIKPGQTVICDMEMIDLVSASEAGADMDKPVSVEKLQDVQNNQSGRRIMKNRIHRPGQAL